LTEEVRDKIAVAAASFDATGLVMQDEIDSSEMTLNLLVPESSISMLIGKNGANVNEMKEASGTNISFAKKETSLRNLRKGFYVGTVASVTKAVFITTSLITEVQEAGSPCNIGIVVSSGAAGSVIGKGGENLKNIREQTGCHVNMEKSDEAIPAFCGRCLTLKHQDSASAVVVAIYQVMRTKGFESVTQRQSNNAANGNTAPADDYGGYGAVTGARGGNRFSPYGGSRPDTCSVHGKRRGKQNLQPSPTNPGQFVCLVDDACKGGKADNAPPAMDMGMYGMGGMGMGGMGMGMGGMGMGGMGMGGMQQQQQQPQNAGAGFCAVHGKKRGVRNLQPHPTAQGMFQCLEEDACK
jgi:transcription antitermination factor NusA-like protein